MNRAREIDRLIAIHLFGLDAEEREVIIGGGGALWDPGKLPVHAPKHIVRRLVVPGSPGDFVEVDRYSTTWVGMGEVIEAMHELIHEDSCREPGTPSRFAGIEWDVNYLTLVGTGLRGYAAGFCYGLDSDPQWYEPHRIGRHPKAARADIAPMAVSLAALAALAVEEQR